MAASRLTRRATAIGLLVGLLVLVGAATGSWIDSYAEGQQEIAEKQAQARDLHDLVRARLEFARLVSKSGKAVSVLATGDDAEANLAATIAHVAEGQQVVVDGVEPLTTPDPALVTATVRLRGTQYGVYSFLRALEEQTPYLLVPRLELTVSRAADPDRGKPLVLSSELHVAALRAPSPAAKTAPISSSGEPIP